MSKQIDRLTDRTCRAAGVGMHHDGRGLYLACRQGVEGTTRSWLLRYTLNSKARWIGLGPYPDVGLAAARKKAQDARSLKHDGVDPLEAKRARRAALHQGGASKSPTFQECAATYIASHEAGWTRKHSGQWTQSLTTYAYPVLGAMPVDSIDTAAVLRVLQPIWRDGVVASRLRNRIELIIDAARAAGHRTAENPARWRGHLDKLLPRPSKVRVVKHHVSLPYRDVPVLMEQLRERDARSALALRFITLTAVRASECLGMTWGEVDLEQRVWTIPAARMKARREHRVPLADQAIELIKRMRHASVTGDARVFACALTALDRLRERMGMEETVHGLRSSFRVWCAECTSFPAEIAEQCLAHAVGDDTERAYQRSDVLEKRRQLMQAWADYCDRQSAEVVPLRAVS